MKVDAFQTHGLCDCKVASFMKNSHMPKNIVAAAANSAVSCHDDWHNAQTPEQDGEHGKDRVTKEGKYIHFRIKVI